MRAAIFIGGSRFFRTSDVRFPISPVTSEGMDCPCSRHYLSAMPHTPTNQKLLASFDSDALSVNQQRIATLHD
jgi:hypothetical protein